MSIFKIRKGNDPIVYMIKDDEMDTKIWISQQFHGRKKTCSHKQPNGGLDTRFIQTSEGEDVSGVGGKRTSY